ncbi:hypothetical protein MLD38_019333 [Melastoma candidum]|uniref:Uncharacterized protein n=1 Tax=Melastoma candidum TaxID=119954 RepID=A0ACB9QXY8_9MYRT|nr:hypothetical protein MLD38_019333 [Melastoma candidum]
MAATVTLHTTKVGMSKNERDKCRRNAIDKLCNSDIYCRDMLRMSTNAFEFLCGKIKNINQVKDYAQGTIQEQLITFLLILGQNFKNRVVGFFLCRSGETISRYFHNMLTGVIMLKDEFVKQPSGRLIQEHIRDNPRFFPWFKDCLGAIDGTHVRVKVSKVDAPKYRGRKDWPTQNVIAACSLDLKFTYILAGWEGSAADSRVLQSALIRSDPLTIPEGKFYLGDAGFGLSSKLLTPNGSARYHLKEYSQRGPQTPKELFNHRHASLRNCIERAFGVLKKRFPINTHTLL